MKVRKQLVGDPRRAGLAEDGPYIVKRVVVTKSVILHDRLLPLGCVGGDGAINPWPVENPISPYYRLEWILINQNLNAIQYSL
jgi:hypothetical protein